MIMPPMLQEKELPQVRPRAFRGCGRQAFATRETAIDTARALSRLQIHCDWFTCPHCKQIHLERVA